MRLRLGGEGIRLRVSGGAVPGEAAARADAENLAVRAAAAFFRAVGQPATVEIELEKTIPVAAGLGGGSSDAAAVLRGLDRLHGDPLAGERLLQVAGELGADVPVFVLDRPLAHGTGRGERLVPLPALPRSPGLILFPRLEIPTADAYRA